MGFTLNVLVVILYRIHASSLLFSCDYYIFAFQIFYAQRILCWGSSIEQAYEP